MRCVWFYHDGGTSCETCECPGRAFFEAQVKREPIPITPRVTHADVQAAQPRRPLAETRRVAAKVTSKSFVEYHGERHRERRRAAQETVTPAPPSSAFAVSDAEVESYWLEHENLTWAQARTALIRERKMVANAS